MQTYQPWSPLPDLPEFFDCFANDGEHALQLFLTTAVEDGRTLILRFQGNVPAYRQILEECRLDACLRGSGSNGQLWKVLESDWLAVFGSADLFHYPGLTHFLVETGNRCFDVLSDKEPAVRWK